MGGDGMTQIILGGWSTFNQWMSAFVSDASPLSFFTTIMSNMAGVITYVYDLLYKVNFIVPIPTIFTMILLNMSINILLWGVWFVNKVINAILDIIP